MSPAVRKLDRLSVNGPLGPVLLVPLLDNSPRRGRRIVRPADRKRYWRGLRISSPNRNYVHRLTQAVRGFALQVRNDVPVLSPIRVPRRPSTPVLDPPAASSSNPTICAPPISPPIIFHFQLESPAR